MATILEEVKTSLGVLTDNLGFDTELLVYLNAAKAALVQLGVVEFTTITIVGGTEWPVLPSNLLGPVKSYIVSSTRLAFDPSASETIAKGAQNQLSVLEGRISNEVEVNDDNN